MPIQTASQALENQGGGSPFGFKNRLINGAMVIDQRNGGSSISAATLGTYGYLVDRWFYYGQQTSKFSAQQNAGSVTPPAGFTNYLGLTSASAYSVTTDDQFFIGQRIEGFNGSDLAWGTSNAKSVTLSFWAYSSLTGNFGFCMQGYNGSSASYYSYPINYSIPVANTWTYVTITIPGPTSGPTGGWVLGNGQFVGLQFGLGGGSAFLGTPGSWQSGSFIGATGARSVVGTNGATLYITGVQLEKGNESTNFDYRPYGTELAMCQRYCYQLTHDGTIPICNGTMNSSTDVRGLLTFPVTMRAAPSMTSSTGSNYYAFDRPGAGFVNFNSILSAYEKPNAALLYNASVTTGVVGYGIVLYLAASGAFIRYTAEL
jgi:hypothetical protein